MERLSLFIVIMLSLVLTISCASAGFVPFEDGSPLTRPIAPEEIRIGTITALFTNPNKNDNVAIYTEAYMVLLERAKRHYDGDIDIRNIEIAQTTNSEGRIPRFRAVGVVIQ